MASAPRDDHPSRMRDTFLDPVVEPLFASRTVLVFGEVDSALAHTVSAQLIALASLGQEPIRIVVN